MDTVLGFGAVLALRVARRALFEYQEKRERSEGADNPERKPALLVGAGRAGLLAAREIVGVGDVALEVKGFVDDDEAKQGSVIHGFPVVGTTHDLPRLVREMEIAQVVITIAPSGSMPNHIGIGCGTPEALMLQMIIVFDPARNDWISSGVMRI